MREYLESKETSRDPDLYSRYKFLNLYKEKALLQRGEHKLDIYGLFLSDLEADGNHGNELHFPVLFTKFSDAHDLYCSIKSHQNIKDFENDLYEITNKESVEERNEAIDAQMRKCDHLL